MILKAPLLKQSTWQNAWHKIGQVSTVVFAFSIPISTALTTLSGLVLLCSWVLGGQWEMKSKLLFQSPLSKALLPLILLILLGLTYSLGNNKEISNAIMCAVRLSFIPLLMVFFKDKKVTQWALAAFISAMLITLILAFGKVYLGFPIGLKYTAGAVFKSHIKTSFFMAISAFFLCHYAKENKRYRIFLIPSILLMIYYLLFMSFGRIGYLSLAVLSLTLAWQWFRWQGIVGAFIILCSLFGITYYTSDVFSQRINGIAQDMEFYNKGNLEESSTGSRIAFAKTSMALIQEHPLTGWGTGSFAAAYAQYHQDENTLLTDNPHNEYLRMGVELGIPGIVSLCFLFMILFQSMQILPSPYKLYYQGILLTFMIGCLFNSWLKDFTEGYFFCFITALCFAYYPIKNKVQTEALFIKRVTYH